MAGYFNMFFSDYLCCCGQKTVSDSTTIIDDGVRKPEKIQRKSTAFICQFFSELWGMKRYLILGGLLITTAVLIDVTVGVFTVGTLSAPTAALTWVNYGVGTGLICLALKHSWNYAKGYVAAQYY